VAHEPPPPLFDRDYQSRTIESSWSSPCHLSLFTRVRERYVLGSSYAKFCIKRSGRFGKCLTTRSPGRESITTCSGDG
jgi:hypothetical protein